MGRFASTVAYYERCREPYPESFFAKVAGRLVLAGKEKLIDVGCGPGILAIGFAPFVSSTTGVDPESAMIASARSAARQAGIELKLIQARVEQLPETIGSFDVVTIGRALHWLEREPVLRVFEWLVSDGGWVVVCGTKLSDSPVNCWAERYNAIRRAWSSETDDRRYRRDPNAWFAGSRFHMIDQVSVNELRQVTTSDLIGRSYSRSTTSPAVIGNRRASFESEVLEALRPFEQDGSLQEEIVASATIFRHDKAMQKATLPTV
jgi:SAM-dependent methyltransferase